MNFTVLDWSAIAGYLLITLVLGLYFRRRSGKSVDDYFLSGRRVSWWLAGTSMVATTFAADTRSSSRAWSIPRESPATGCGGRSCSPA